MGGFVTFLAGIVVGVVLKVIYDKRKSSNQSPAPPDAPSPNGRKRR